jgi:hypothetical protein
MTEDQNRYIKILARQVSEEFSVFEIAKFDLGSPKSYLCSGADHRLSAFKASLSALIC